jgi:hypothetical protein
MVPSLYSRSGKGQFFEPARACRTQTRRDTAAFATRPGQAGWQDCGTGVHVSQLTKPLGQLQSYRSEWQCLKRHLVFSY